MKNILKVALIYALFGILLSLVIALVDKSLMFKGAVSTGSLVVGLIILVVAGRKYFRNEEEGILSYGEAMKKLLLASLIGMFLSTVVSVARFSNDAEMKTLFKEYTLSTTESMMRMTMGLTGVDEAQLEDTILEAREEIEKNVDSSYPFAWPKLPITLINVVVISLILSLISAIFVREKDTAHS